MDEGKTEKREKPINLFPIGRQSVLDAFKRLNYKENSVSLQEAKEEERELGQSNPHVLTDLERLLELHTEESAKQLFRGTLISHRALQNEAKHRGLVLPRLKEEFVEGYAEQKESSAEKSKMEAWHDKKLDTYQAAGEFRKSEISKFRNLEPEFSSIAERELNDRPNWIPEEDIVYRGIIYEYLLLREGFSDAKNFSKNFSI
ncbi:MAG: hypothetical protein AAB583_02145 [Patescibacteria group bacterium]